MSFMLPKLEIDDLILEFDGKNITIKVRDEAWVITSPQELRRIRNWLKTASHLGSYKG